MTSFSNKVMIQPPQAEGYYSSMFLGAHLVTLRAPQLRSFMVMNCEARPTDIPALADKDGYLIDGVFTWSYDGSALDSNDDDEEYYDGQDHAFLRRHQRSAKQMTNVVYDVGDTIRVYVHQIGSHTTFGLLGEQDDDLQPHIDWIRRHFFTKKIDSDKVKLSFTCEGHGGTANTSDREITAISWAEIRRNYSDTVLAKMDALVKFRPDEGTAGKIGILLGPPGTGKTHFIRALAKEWKDWATFNYVMDVETFFNNAQYMLDIALNTSQNKWDVILCEDAEEYIAPDSKKEVGQALSRLVNMGDGLIGQGLRILLLFTTNKPDAALHEAITRPGRCFTKLTVPLLSPAEASEWAGTYIDTEMSLADLYELQHQTMITSPDQPSNVGQYL
jgi:hypothetical protein